VAGSRGIAPRKGRENAPSQNQEAFTPGRVKGKKKRVGEELVEGVEGVLGKKRGGVFITPPVYAIPTKKIPQNFFKERGGETSKKPVNLQDCLTRRKKKKKTQK